MPTDQSPSQQADLISLKEFFETVAPGTTVRATVAPMKGAGVTGSRTMDAPPIQLYCDSESCRGLRTFEPRGQNLLKPSVRHNLFLSFVCRNCTRSVKTYAFWCVLNQDEVTAELHKYGEFPSFGPRIPAKVITLIGPEREYFLKGRRAESHGLGIAAFAYYRRVVENQKARIIGEIIRVAEKMNASKEQVSDLLAAKDETQFSRAVGAIKHGIPQSLLVDGHNPLVLLHSALSEGLHARTDQQCLELAKSIRIVLTDLVERMDLALKEELQLKSAVSRLLQASAEKNDGDKSSA